MCALIIASTAALLGTTDETVQHYAAYHFARTGVDGGFAELTSDAPRATFFVTLTANQLGPDGVETSDNASATLDATLTASALPEGTDAPFVDVRITSPEASGVIDKQVLDHLSDTQALSFTGNCSKPTEGAACRARFQVDVWRIDDGARGGTVRFDWLFDVASFGQIQVPDEADTKTTSEPLDPPWTISVTQQ